VERTDFAPGEELKIYRRRRAGKPIAPEYEQHFAALTPNQRDQFEQMAPLHDERDEKVREEIADHPEGYAWHKGPGGGLPFDWSDSELPRLRPRDWRQAEAIQFVSASSPRQQKVRGRARALGGGRTHRPGGGRRAASSSSTSSSDPGGDSGDDGESSDDDDAARPTAERQQPQFPGLS
jgi:hypothetical protein